MSELLSAKCYDDIQTAHVRPDYQSFWYDKHNANENMADYFITVPAKNGDLYFTVESYPKNSVPKGCTSGTFTYNTANGQQTGSAEQPLLYFALYNINDLSTPIQYQYYIEQFQRPIMLTES